MFEAFYGFERTPFTRSIPTDQLYQSLILEETLGRLQYAAERQMFAVVTGDCGTGKTTTIRRFQDVLDSSRFKQYVGKANHHYVLKHFLAKKVIDSENLILPKYICNRFIQCEGGL
jgi:type II secretory pathway predicted ATPase ExeA